MRRSRSLFGGARTRVVLLAACATGVLGLAGASTFGASAAPSGLVAAYSFDAGSGTTLKDDSGHGNTGTISGATWASGLRGKALSFNGLNNLVRIPDSASLDMTTGATLEAWVNPKTLSGLWRTVILKEMPGELSYALYAKGDTANPVGIVNTGSEQFARSGSALSTRKWQFLAVTYDGTSAKLYVNGTLVQSVAAPGAILTSNGALDIGGNNVWSEWFSGSIDDVRVYNRALSVPELNSDMVTPVTTATTPPPAQTDTTAPTVPTSLKTSGVTATQATLSWTGSTDNVGVAGYGAYLNGAGNGSSSPSTTSFTFTGLKCGTYYTLGVDAFDAAGNRSASTSAGVSTAACAPTTTDTSPPTVPLGMHTTNIGISSVSLAWNGSNDNVGVAGYYLLKNGVRVGSTPTLAYTFYNLSCNTTYTLAISAYDAAGNTSNPAYASTDETTGPCGTPPTTTTTTTTTTPTTTATTTTTAPTTSTSTTTSSGAPTGPAAVFVSPNGSDSGPCTSSNPCKSLDRAYHAAVPGNIVEVAGGTYPPQDVNVDNTKTSSSDVVFRPAAGATVTFGCGTTSTVGGGTIGGQTCIDVFASHITFDGGSSKAFRTQTYSVDGFSYQGRIDTERGATDITFRNMDVGAVAVGSSNTLVTHNDLGPSVDPLNNRQASGVGNVWQDNLIHDYVIENGGHMECVTWDGGTNITFEYNEFRSCVVFAIFAKPVDNISGKVDHNVFWNPRNLTTNNDVKVSLGSGATRCDVATTNNWISESTYMDCPGATESGNTSHDPSTQPPSPIRP